MSTIEPGNASNAIFSRRNESSPISDDRLSSLVTKTAVAELTLTSVHHVYGAQLYATPWRLHVLLLTIPAIVVILGARRRLQRSPGNSAARWGLMLVTLAVPVLGIGAFEGVYNHLVKNVLFFLGARTEVMARLFPSPTYEMPNDAIFEITGVSQAILGAATASSLVRFAVRGPHEVGRSSPRAPTFVAPRPLTTISNQLVRVPDPESLVHLQFRRFAGCPICNVHLQSFARRHRELGAASVREVVVFHSSPEELRVYASDLPFSVVGDPDKVLYAEFGMESSPRSVLDPRAWGAILLGVLRAVIARVTRGDALPPVRPHGGSFGLPGDFLIAQDGHVIASKYGRHADDHWSVDEVLALARDAVRAPHRAVCVRS